MNNKRTIIIIILLILIGGEFSLMASPQKQVLEFSTAGFFNSPQLRTVYNFNPAWRFFKGKANGAECVDFDDKDWQYRQTVQFLPMIPFESEANGNS